jgi:hypothetical protein
MEEINPTLDRIRMTVIQNEKGDCKAIEHDLVLGVHRTAGEFPADKRKFTSEEGEERVLDMAQVRAVTFAQLFEKMVNDGNIHVG